VEVMSWPVRFLDISVSQHPNRYSWYGGVLVATLFCAISPTVGSQTDLDATRDALCSLGSGNYETGLPTEWLILHGTENDISR